MLSNRLAYWQATQASPTSSPLQVKNNQQQLQPRGPGFGSN
jgi:hypothetical protein